jgi:DNA-binding NtrC family response regulator
MTAANGAQRCLLVAEDDADLHMLYARVAQREGFRVESAHSGEQAMLILKNSARVDALLTDIRLSGNIDGWDLGNEFIRSHPHGCVIYVSGVEPDQADRAENTLFLQKPVHIADLTAVLRQIR